MWVAHAPGMPGTFSPPPTSKETVVSDPGMHPGTCVTHVPWCMSGSLTCGSGENAPGIPGACTTRNVTYLVRDPWQLFLAHTSSNLMCPHFGNDRGNTRKPYSLQQNICRSHCTKQIKKSQVYLGLAGIAFSYLGLKKTLWRLWYHI